MSFTQKEQEVAAERELQATIRELCRKTQCEHLVDHFISNGYSLERVSMALLNVKCGRPMNEPLRPEVGDDEGFIANVQSLCNRAGVTDQALRAHLAIGCRTLDEVRAELDAQRVAFPGKFRRA